MNFPRILSPNTKIYWAGWEGQTVALQRAGWEISAQQDVACYGYRLAIKHPLYKMYGLTEMASEFEVRQHFQSSQPHPLRPLKLVYMASEMKVMLRDDMTAFSPIDAIPSVCTTEIRDIEDFKIFKPIGLCEQVIIEPKSIPILLDEILKVQAPNQKELREKKRREYRKFQREFNNMTKEFWREYDPRKEIVAQVVTL